MTARLVTASPANVQADGAWLLVELDTPGERCQFALSPHAAMMLLRDLTRTVPGFIGALNTATVIKFPKAAKRLRMVKAKREKSASN